MREIFFKILNEYLDNEIIHRGINDNNILLVNRDRVYEQIKFENSKNKDLIEYLNDKSKEDEIYELIYTVVLLKPNCEERNYFKANEKVEFL